MMTRRLRLLTLLIGSLFCFATPYSEAARKAPPPTRLGTEQSPVVVRVLPAKTQAQSTAEKRDRSEARDAEKTKLVWRHVNYET